MGHQRIVHHRHIFKIDFRRFLVVAVLGGLLIDLTVIYLITPRVWADPAPPISQFLVWEAFWIVIGLAMLFGSRAKSNQPSAGTVSVKIIRFLILSVGVGVATDIAVIFFLAPMVWNEPVPPVAQYAIWELLWNAIGLTLFYLSRAKKK